MMTVPPRSSLLLPDALLLLHETEGAKDPLFGVMISGEAVPSPRTLTQVAGTPGLVVGVCSKPECSGSKPNVHL